MPFHQSPVLMFSTATAALATLVPPPELDEAVPVMPPAQLPP